MQNFVDFGNDQHLVQAKQKSGCEVKAAEEKKKVSLFIYIELMKTHDEMEWKKLYQNIFE